MVTCLIRLIIMFNKIKKARLNPWFDRKGQGHNLIRDIVIIMMKKALIFRLVMKTKQNVTFNSRMMIHDIA